jgi:hypothetical protein
LNARDWVPPSDDQHYACTFSEALWGHIHGTLPPRYDATDVDPPPPSSDAANVRPPSLVSGFPRAGGVSSADIQPPPPSPPRKLKFTVTLPAGEFDFDFNSQAGTDSSEDRFQDYIPPVSWGDALHVFLRLNGTYGCHVCPHLMHRWHKLNEVKDHILGMAKSAPLRQNYKNWSRHHVVARNEVWM